MQYIGVFICGLGVGTLLSAIVGWQWFSATRDEVYEQGVSHGRERERRSTHRELFQRRTDIREPDNA